jgi:hypothetical protein
MQRMPRATGAADEADGIHGLAIIAAGSMAPERVRLPRREARLDARPSRIRETPIAPNGLLSSPQIAAACRRASLRTGYHQDSLLG